MKKRKKKMNVTDEKHSNYMDVIIYFKKAFLLKEKAIYSTIRLPLNKRH